MSDLPSYRSHEPSPIPVKTGIGLRAQHYRTIFENYPKIAWLEIHSENYFSAGGKHLFYLDHFRCHYPLSLHGVGLSLGSTAGVNIDHLEKLRILIERFAPYLVSEHLCWSSVNGKYLNDLLPLPYTEEALQHMSNRVDQVQDYLKRQILIENISSYLQFTHSTIPESEFLVALAQHTGCAILLDINNLYINAVNHGWNAKQYLQTIPSQLVQEIHLAGYTKNQFEDKTILIDTHNQLVSNEVWILYAEAIRYFGKVRTLIEWDKDLPELSILLHEAEKADAIMENAYNEIS